MSLTLTITPKELERQAALAFEGKGYAVRLCSDPTLSLDQGSTVAEWEALELASTNGYAAATGTIGVGSYNSTAGAYELPSINAQFTATSTGFSHDAVVITIDGATYPHSYIRLSEPLVLQAGQSKSYVLKLMQDD